MCGIVGVVGKIGKKERDAFRQLLIVDSLRGADSTGFFTVKGNDVGVFKAVGDPYMAMESRAFDRELIKSSNILVGHNRFATTGKVNRKNAHPFEFDKVVGVHNGTLKNKYALRDGNTFEVDSEALYNSFNVIGADATIPQVEGAWSLVWWDKVEKELCFLRNDQRPMCVALSEDRKTMFFASEAGMLSWILARNDIKIGDIKATAVDQLYKLKVKDEFEGVATELPMLTMRKLEGKPPVFPVAPVKNEAKGAGSYAGNAARMTKASSYLNTTVSFYTETVLYVDGTPYCVGELATSRESVPIMVCLFGNHTLAEHLMDADILTYTGKVLSVRYLDGEAYLVINPNSVAAEGAPVKKQTARILTLKPKTAGEEYTGFKGRRLTMIEWRDKTACGCSKCGSFPMPEEKDLIEWQSEDSFLCKYCHL